MRPQITVLAGGVGAARFLRGLQPLTDPHRLTVIGNTGDDEEVWGLHVSPDLDTVLYTLAGQADRQHGWGIAGDTFACLGAMRQLRQPAWFRLGDRDLAVNLLRTGWLRTGVPLSVVTRRLTRLHGVQAQLLPMTDQRVRTFIHTGAGRLAFHDYLVRRRARGVVRRIEVAGARSARPAPGVLAALGAADMILLAPSNPFVSLGPMLALPGFRRALTRRRGRAVAISPLVGGRPVKGPLHKMLRGLGHPVTPLAVCRLYCGLVDVFVLDTMDAHWAAGIAALGIEPVVTDTIMTTPARAARLATTVLRAARGPSA